MSSAKDIAAEFVAACKEAGFTFEVTGTTVRISHTFPPGDTEGFLALDCTATSILQLLPNSGSTYGLEGVGGHIALTKGFGTVKHTDVRKTVIRALTNA